MYGDHIIPPVVDLESAQDLARKVRLFLPAVALSHVLTTPCHA
jgi:hypothetical protein